MKVLKVSYYTIMFLLFAWFVASYIDIIADNCLPNPVHHPLNMFILMSECFK